MINTSNNIFIDLLNHDVRWWWVHINCSLVEGTIITLLKWNVGVGMRPASHDLRRDRPPSRCGYHEILEDESSGGKGYARHNHRTGTRPWEACPSFLSAWESLTMVFTLPPATKRI